MTTFYGDAVYNGAAWMRLRLDISHAVDPSGAFASVAIELRVETNYAVSDPNNAGELNADGFGTWTGTTSIAHGASGGSTLLHSFGGPIALVYGAPINLHVWGSLSGIQAVPGTASIDKTYQLPARPIGPPAAPTTVAVSRVSDDQHTITWTPPTSTPAAPVTSQAVQRSTDGAWWASIATVGGAAGTYSDPTTSAGHRYQYRIVALNDAGATASTASAVVQTTPAAPSGITAVKTAAGDILVTVANAQPGDAYDYTTPIEHSSDGGATWSALATLGEGPTLTYTHTAPSIATTHRYRAATRSAAGATLTSAWVTSATVQLAAPPSAPANLAAAPTPLPASESVTVSWTHNPVDSSPQSKRQLRWRVAGTSTWTEGAQVATAAASLALLPSAWGGANGGSLEWQVRTWGQHADPSPWSATAVIVLSSRPTVSLATPGGVVNTSQVTVSWTYYDAEGTDQAAWIAKLVNAAGAVVEELTAPGAAGSATFATVLPDGSSWTIRVAVQDGVGLWSTTAERAFTVSYPAPPTPEVDAIWDPVGGTVTLAVTNPPPEAGATSGFGVGAFGVSPFGSPFGGGSPVPDTDHVDVARSIDGGVTWEAIVVGAPTNTAITDHAPRVEGDTLYRVDAVSALPSVSSVTVTVTASGAEAVFISGGPGFSQVCRARWNVDITDEDGPERTLVAFAGRRRPVALEGDVLTRVVTLEADYIPTSDDPGSTPEQWRALGILPGPHLWRDPDGRYLRVTISRPHLVRDRSDVLHHLTLSATQVDA